MTKNEKLDDLFISWINRTVCPANRFHKDGIINEVFFDKSNIKVLYLMKEANNAGGDSWDFREWFSEEIKYTFAKKLRDLSFGFQYDFPPFDERGKRKEDLVASFHSSAFMNIKKTGGKGNSSFKEVMQYTAEHLDLIHAEIQIINPDIIVCGLSWQKLRDLIFPDAKWHKSGYNLPIGEWKDYKLIDYYHPSSRIVSSAFYSLMQNVVRHNAGIGL